MGPRFCKRGNMDPRLHALLSKNKLQWGHAFVSVETIFPRTGGNRLRSLQWGHAFVSVETRGGQRGAHPHPELQWGHAFVSVETP